MSMNKMVTEGDNVVVFFRGAAPRKKEGRWCLQTALCNTALELRRNVNYLESPFGSPKGMAAAMRNIRRLCNYLDELAR